MLKPVLWLGSIVLAGVVTWAGMEVAGAYATHAERQAQLNRQLAMFKATYETLRGVEEQWNGAFPAASDNIDVLRLHRLMDISRFSGTQPDDIEVVSMQQVNYNGMDLPLFEVCVTNNAGRFIMHTPNVVSALSRLQIIGARSDLRFYGVALTREDTRVRIALNALCAYLRPVDEAV